MIKSKSKNVSEKNGQWRGNKVGYSGLHAWVKRRLFKPGFCEECRVNTPNIDLANISQKYKRDLSDWEWICRLCHMKKDGRLKILIENGKKLDLTKDPRWINRRIAKGTLVNTNILSAIQVLEIRKMIFLGKRRCDIASRFKVSKSCIDHIAARHNWKWLK